jgi:hypothetical protein
MTSQGRLPSEEDLQIIIDEKTAKQRMYLKRLETKRREIMSPCQPKTPIEHTRIKQAYRHLVETYCHRPDALSSEEEYEEEAQPLAAGLVPHLKAKERPQCQLRKVARKEDKPPIIVPWKVVPLHLKKQYMKKPIVLLNKEPDYDLLLDGGIL